MWCGVVVTKDCWRGDTGLLLLVFAVVAFVLLPGHCRALRFTELCLSLPLEKLFGVALALAVVHVTFLEELVVGEAVQIPLHLKLAWGWG